MNRREILKGIIFAVPTILLPKKILGMVVDIEDCPFKKCKGHIKGYCLHWTGWKSSVNTSMMAGQWLAWNKTKRKYIYSNTSIEGKESGLGFYNLGDVFDISYSPDLFYLTESGFTTDDEGIEMPKLEFAINAIKSRDRSYDRLLRFIKDKG